MKKKTRKEYIDEIAIKNPDVELVGDYIDANTKTKFRCKIHNEIWESTPSRVLYGHGCSKCHSERISKNKTFTNEDYLELLASCNLDIIPLEPYVTMKTPILHQCLKHNIIWSVSPDSILHGHGCKQCGNEIIALKNSRTHDEYIAELNNVNEDIVCISHYKDALTPILHKCKKCGYEWETTPARLLFGGGCPICKASHGERAIKKWLESNNIEYEAQKKFDECKDKKCLPFDFYLPQHRIAIEFDGEQHYRSVDFFGGEKSYQKRIYHDKIKDSFCELNNINLIRIPYNADVQYILAKSIYLT